MPEQAVGPNHIWSMEAWRGFEAYGIVVYGIMDVYSRHVLWHYVGIADTEMSVLAQYQQCVEQLQVMPEILQIHRSIKHAALLAATHTLLINQVPQPDEELLDEDVVQTGGKAHMGSYWSEQSRMYFTELRLWFEELVDDLLYDKSSLVDRIALVGIYVPIMRHLTQVCAQHHSRHRVRKQGDKPSYIPWSRYHHPYLSGGQDRGSSPNEQFVESLRQPFDLDEYLPAETLEWCENILKVDGFYVPPNLERNDDGEHLHYGAYLWLRKQIDRHADRYCQPVLKKSYPELSPPVEITCDAGCPLHCTRHPFWRTAIEEAADEAASRSVEMDQRVRAALRELDMAGAPPPDLLMIHARVARCICSDQYM